MAPPGNSTLFGKNRAPFTPVGRAAKWRLVHVSPALSSLAIAFCSCGTSLHPLGFANLRTARGYTAKMRSTHFKLEAKQLAKLCWCVLHFIHGAETACAVVFGVVGADPTALFPCLDRNTSIVLRPYYVSGILWRW